MSGITNPAEVYFKDGIWTWASTVWEKLISSGGRLFTALHGWDGSAWRKLPLLFGYSGRLAERITGAASGGGDVAVSSTAVPAGDVYVVQQVTVYHGAAANKQILTQAKTGTVDVGINHQISAVPAQRYFWTGELVLKEGDYVQAYLYTPGDGVSVYLEVWGYKMKIAE